MQYRDLSKAVLSLQPRSLEADRSLHIPQNQPFITQERNEIENLKRTDRDATPHLVPPTIKLTVQTDKIPRNKHGWIFGSDPQICDYLLDTDKSNGVSGAHFEIFYNWKSMVLLVKNLSRNQLGIETDEGLEIIGQTRALCQADCHISVGLLTFHLEIPDRGELQLLYTKNLETHRSIVTGAIPELSTLAVKQRGEATPAVQEVLATATSSSTKKYIRRYRVGGGSSGTVYNGIEKSSGNEVALKDFHDKRKPEEILAEIDILRHLAHVHITRYIDVVNNPEPLLVMEFVRGGNLATLRNVSLCETLLMAQQTSQAVSYLHDNGITHRDIKPANILIVSRGRDFNCKVADFGESSMKPILETYCGTSMYQAPEVLKPPYSKAVDIWSLGMILVEYWFDWYPLCLNELSFPSRDSWLPDTQRSGVPGAGTFLGNKVQELDWTNQIKQKWLAIIHQRLQEEDCHMAQILLQMLEADPVKRIKASLCRSRLDSIPLPDESGTRQELRVSHKRNFEQAGLDDPSASRYTCCSPQQLVIETTRVALSQHSRRPKQHAAVGNDQEGSGPALPTIIESLEIAGTVYQPHSPTTTNSIELQVQVNKRDSRQAELDLPNASRRTRRNSKALNEESSAAVGSQNQPKGSGVELSTVSIGASRSSNRPETSEEAFPRQLEQTIRLCPESREINATDILKATGRKRLKAVSKYVRRATRMGTYISYEDARALIRYLDIPETSAITLFQAMEQNQREVKVPVTDTVLKKTRQQTGGIVHIDPARSIINATNLVNAAGLHRSVLADLKKDFASCTFVRAHGRQGTYVNYEDGLKLCDRLDLPKVVVKEAMDTGKMLVRIPAANPGTISRLSVQQQRYVTDEDKPPPQALPQTSILSSTPEAASDMSVFVAIPEDAKKDNQKRTEISLEKKNWRGEKGGSKANESIREAGLSAIENSEENNSFEDDMSEDESSEDSSIEVELSESDNSSEGDEPSENDVYENEGAQTSTAESPARSTSQGPILSEAGPLSPLQQFYPCYGPSSYVSHNGSYLDTSSPPN